MGDSVDVSKILEAIHVAYNPAEEEDTTAAQGYLEEIKVFLDTEWLFLLLSSGRRNETFSWGPIISPSFPPSHNYRQFLAFGGMWWSIFGALMM